MADYRALRCGPCLVCVFLRTLLGLPRRKPCAPATAIIRKKRHSENLFAIRGPLSRFRGVRRPFQGSLSDGIRISIVIDQLERETFIPSLRVHCYLGFGSPCILDEHLEGARRIGLGLIMLAQRANDDWKLVW